MSVSQQETQCVLKWGTKKVLNRKCLPGMGRSKGSHQEQSSMSGGAARRVARAERER